jgi:hypothetical protein
VTVGFLSMIIFHAGLLPYFTHSSFVVKRSMSPWRKDSGRSHYPSILIAPQSTGCFVIVYKGTLVKWGAMKSFSAEDIHGEAQALFTATSSVFLFSNNPVPKPNLLLLAPEAPHVLLIMKMSKL